MADGAPSSARNAKKSADLGRIFLREELRAKVKQVTAILNKPEQDRSTEDEQVLQLSPDIVENIQKNVLRREKAKARVQEVEDPPEMLTEKCRQLAQAIREAEHLVIYTGAGISTAASIPDYRGPNGVWTLLQKGESVSAQDLSEAEPTVTHMAITELYSHGFVEHVVSQNCDGLHIRSGLPRHALSELHGNMYIELCTNCQPPQQYLRLFDVTENTGVRRHKTGRHCHRCEAELRDTIVHFGEKGPFMSPYNWKEAADAADEADVIICLGSSLKVLRRYPCLWSMHKPVNKRPKLFIVNLQWTPKDDCATMKINGRCDDIIQRVMSAMELKIPAYSRIADPMFRLATPLRETELTTTSKKVLQPLPLDIKIPLTTGQLNIKQGTPAATAEDCTKPQAGPQGSGTSSHNCDNKTEYNRPVHSQEDVKLLNWFFDFPPDSPTDHGKLNCSLNRSDATDAGEGVVLPCRDVAQDSLSGVHIVMVRKEEGLDHCSNAVSLDHQYSAQQTSSNLQTQGDSSITHSHLNGHHLSQDGQAVFIKPDKMEESDSDQTSSEVKLGSKRLISCSTPGWFGKGLNLRKNKRKKSK